MKNKSKRANSKPFKLSGKATEKLNNYLMQIRQGIVNVCRLHTYDTAPSLEQDGFEELYIDKLLSQTVAALSVSMRSMAEGLTKQKEAEQNKVFNLQVKEK